MKALKWAVKIVALVVFVASILSPAIADSDTPFTEGTVRKVDFDQGKITIKHGAIVNLGMPPMTMVFTMKDAGQMEGVEKGDDVRFRVIEENGKMVIEMLEKAEGS